MSAPGSFIEDGSTAAAGLMVAAQKARLTMLLIQNKATSLRYVKVYDKDTEAIAADTPKLRFQIPPAAASGASIVSVPLPMDGAEFANGISIRVVTGQADNDNTAATANDVTLDYTHKLA